MKQITIKNIASKVNLSVSTVSRALNDHPDIHTKTKKLVREAASELGYNPNIIARNLKSSRSNQIGVIVPEIRHDFFANAISGIEEVAYQNGYTIIIAQSNEQQEREIINLDSMYLHRVAGIIVSISQTTTSSNHFKRLLDKGVKMVFFDRVCNDLKTPRIHIDDMESSYEVVKYLLGKGYSKVVHFAGPQSLDICKNRQLGYEKALKDLRTDYEPLIFEGGMHESDGYKHVTDLINSGISSCAIFAVNDPVAVGAIKRLKELNIKVPDQIGIVGFSNNPITEMISPSLTTVDQHSFEMGRQAAEILIDEIEGRNDFNSELDIKLDTELIIREST
ncbi:MAG: LacI family transcriptional regulator [Ignavibacteria bacterium GWA2_35_9]|nr:MAG: LacI family transcriptional regulator [Ignavibacteria bacterium GWA2_35_9]OGU49179.1 MAG: LacI family transcriptional regulator [Ignavibacteria bacterium GWC2_36_12]